MALDAAKSFKLLARVERGNRCELESKLQARSLNTVVRRFLGTINEE
jgi:hypothetical protein